MGGFSKIYPLDTSDPANVLLMERYDNLIFLEDDLN
jgi:hypothetical protein